MKLGKDNGMCPPSCEPGDPLHLFLEAPSSLPLRGNGRLSVTLINPTDKEKEVQLVIGAQALYYNGVLATGLWMQKQFLMLGPNQGNTLWPQQTPCTYVVFFLGSTHGSPETAFSPLVLTLIQHIYIHITFRQHIYIQSIIYICSDTLRGSQSQPQSDKYTTNPGSKKAFGEPDRVQNRKPLDQVGALYTQMIQQRLF